MAQGFDGTNLAKMGLLYSIFTNLDWKPFNIKFSSLLVIFAGISGKLHIKNFSVKISCYFHSTYGRLN